MINAGFDTSKLKYDDNGLICAIVQHSGNGNVLMVGYMNEESLNATISTGKATFYSRSRQKLWIKGETSGNFLNIVRIKPDCDADALLVLALPEGPACHTGDYSCFGDAVAFDGYIIDLLANTVKKRRDALESGVDTDNSYTIKLLKAGKDRILRKIGEEATETVIAAKNDDRQEFIGEVSDLLFHLMVLLGNEGIDFSEITQELADRHGKSHGLPKTRV